MSSLRILLASTALGGLLLRGPSPLDAKPRPEHKSAPTKTASTEDSGDFKFERPRSYEAAEGSLFELTLIRADSARSILNELVKNLKTNQSKRNLNLQVVLDLTGRLHKTEGELGRAYSSSFLPTNQTDLNKFQALLTDLASANNQIRKLSKFVDPAKLKLAPDNDPDSYLLDHAQSSIRHSALSQKHIAWMREHFPDEERGYKPKVFTMETLGLTERTLLSYSPPSKNSERPGSRRVDRVSRFPGWVQRVETEKEYQEKVHSDWIKRAHHLK